MNATTVHDHIKQLFKDSELNLDVSVTINKAGKGHEHHADRESIFEVAGLIRVSMPETITPLGRGIMATEIIQLFDGEFSNYHIGYSDYDDYDDEWDEDNQTENRKYHDYMKLRFVVRDTE